MIPDNQEYRVRLANTYYLNGQLVMEFTVLVPDRTISGDYRHEPVTVTIPAKYVE